MTNPPIPQTEAEQIASRLTGAQRSALVPFVTFSDATGRQMKQLGLLSEVDGVWNHTPLGMQVRRAILEQRS